MVVVQTPNAVRPSWLQAINQLQFPHINALTVPPPASPTTTNNRNILTPEMVMRPLRIVRILVTDGDASDSSSDDEEQGGRVFVHRERVKKFVNEIAIESCFSRENDGAGGEMVVVQTPNAVRPSWLQAINQLQFPHINALTVPPPASPTTTNNRNILTPEMVMRPLRIVRILVTDGDASDSSSDDEEQGGRVFVHRERVKKFVNEIAIESCFSRENDGAGGVWRSSRSSRKRLKSLRGYLAPEYAMRGQLTEKTDIFAFDVLTLATVSGRPNSDMSLDEKTSLLGWVWNLNKEGRELEVVDSAITLSGLNEEQIRRVIRIALLCTQTSPSLRPTMSCVVAMLLGDVQVTNELTTPGFLSDRKFDRLIRSISDTATRGTFTSFYNASAGTSMVSNAGQSVIKPINILCCKTPLERVVDENLHD
ncbi:hypothetical protein FEM48_Zijuj05G0037800 [Ziziphus jujuba var. spinosa]|uniref:Uncharacterized protein n=1 Tax=Ziziphus jujuba var. spinosa TaxID=714518 RepID=A0A978VCM8_ZIZJJ|nr:hypothetical protein FEM48_Zijuj05G0037800 [Ziziphus jujuba var. spinosa]